MYVYLSKILPLLVLPTGLVILLLILSLLLLRWSRIRLASFTLLMAVAILWVASTPYVANSITLANEAQYPPVASDDVPQSGCIVLLGGFVSAAIPPRQDIELSGAVDRGFKAAELYLAGKAPVVIVSGGRQPWSKSSRTEADLIQELLMRWQVPEEAILTESRSRNTRENALFSSEIIQSIACEQPLLVTSAAHMPRAVAAFESLGIGVFPVTTDVHGTFDGSISKLSWLDFMPQAGALSSTSDGMREWIGRKVYALKGWN